MRLNGPFPLLVLNGVQGSAKSTTARILKILTEPEKVRDRSARRDDSDLAIWASNSRILSVDNLSRFPDWLSDAYCRMATGRRFETRTLYENEDETIFDAKRPVILNVIEDFVTRGDLLERSIILLHPSIADGRRRLESELYAEFEKARPRLLGALFDRRAAGLFVIPDEYRKRAQGISGWRNCNLRTTFKKVIRRAGVDPWPRLWHSLRSSCESDLAQSFPLAVAT